MQLGKRVLWLMSIMIIVTLSVEAIAVGLLYQTSFREERTRLYELAKSQARLIESIFRFSVIQEAPVIRILKLGPNPI